MTHLPGVVILDRDGVINHDSPDYIKSPAEWLEIAGSADAIARLNRAGIPVMVATNQAGLARGLFDLPALHAIHNKMRLCIENAGGKLIDIAYCPHHPDDGCDCRKPQPGMLLQLAERHQFNLADAVFVGDSSKDMQAANAAGCEGVLVLTGNGKQTLEAMPSQQHHATLADYVNAIGC